MNGFAAVVASYLVGGIPFAVLAGRLKGIDVLHQGSGNPGASNAIRLLGPALGVTVLVLDIAKGLAAVTVIAPLANARAEPWPLACAVAAVLGHIWPVALRFRGGKGVATAAGAFLGLAPAAMAITAGMFALALGATRYMSVASMTGAVTLPISLAALGAERWTTGLGLAVGALVLVRHRANLARLRAGTESRLGAGARKAAT